MKSIKTLALVTGLLAIQRRFPSSIQFDLDCRERLRLSRLSARARKTQPCKRSADYAFGDSGFSIGAWASNVDFGR